MTTTFPCRDVARRSGSRTTRRVTLDKAGLTGYSLVMTNTQSVDRVVVCQLWAERERGWGVRPDGYSLHLTADHLRRYVSAYWSRMPDTPPDEYECPSGESYLVLVSADVMAKLYEKDGSARIYSNVDLPQPA